MNLVEQIRNHLDFIDDDKRLVICIALPQQSRSYGIVAEDIGLQQIDYQRTGKILTQPIGLAGFAWTPQEGRFTRWQIDLKQSLRIFLPSRVLDPDKMPPQEKNRVLLTHNGPSFFTHSGGLLAGTPRPKEKTTAGRIEVNQSGIHNSFFAQKKELCKAVIGRQANSLQTKHVMHPMLMRALSCRVQTVGVPIWGTMRLATIGDLPAFHPQAIDFTEM